ncbi:hypothetical protein BGAL_0610g00030 [Botrytis galanthina]|uniref:Uncharacterized protein n=1 Tax=Botrytis galanthina TaxID=278940 RepID=A0A4V4HT89_9HELO|nr:hypothetical protein BGAL_0610g00030 [Botrytis galanthina]
MTFITPPFKLQSILTQDDPECTKLYWDSTYLDRIDLDRLDPNPDSDNLYDGTMKAARERYPHVLPLFALWEYISEEWVLDSWTKPNGGQQTVADELKQKKETLFPSVARINTAYGKFAEHSHPLSGGVHHTMKHKPWAYNWQARGSNRYDHIKKSRPWYDWNLPQNHPRHILSFPTDILDRIMEFVMIVCENTVVPFTITSNSMPCHERPDYMLYPSRTHGKSLINNRFCNSGYGLNNRWCYNREGPCRKWDQSTYPILNISYLKVCKSFKYIGSKLFYGQNTLEFATGNLVCADSPAGLIAERGIKYYPWLRQPIYDPGNTRGWVRSVNKAISCIKTQSNLKDLPAWAWCDPFVRFLFTIGPDNSAELQRLNFSGQVKSYSSIRYTDRHEDFVQSMRIYIYIINILCPKVWKVTLVAWGENDILGDENDGKCLTAFEKSLAMFLETEFRDLSCQGRMHSFCDPIVTGRGTLVFAKPTMDWFVNRARILDNFYQHSIGIDYMQSI